MFVVCFIPCIHFQGTATHSIALWSRLSSVQAWGGVPSSHPLWHSIGIDGRRDKEKDNPLSAYEEEENNTTYS